MTHQDPRVDRSRGAVYQAEDTIASVMGKPHRLVRVGGAIHELPAEVHFGTLAAVQDFVDAVLADPDTERHFPGRGAIAVHAKRGFRSANYAGGIMRVPATDPRGRWALTRSVVLHEIAHHLAGAPGHGSSFRAALVHLYNRHVSTPAAQLLGQMFAPLADLPEPTPADELDGPARRVAALLAKAESTTSAEESEAYLAKAALVAQRHSVDLAVAALGTDSAADPRAQRPSHRMVTIGAPRRPLNTLLVRLMSAVAAASSVRMDIGPGSTYVLLYGMPGDLDQVESMFATASTLMVTRAGQHVESGQWRGTTYMAADGHVRPVTATVARNAFCLGFTGRLAQRLGDAAEQARNGATDAGRSGRAAGAGPRHAGGSTAGADRVAVALRAKEVAVTDYYRSVTRARGSWRGSASAAGSAGASRRAGARAADELGRSRLPGGRRAIGA